MFGQKQLVQKGSTNGIYQFLHGICKSLRLTDTSMYVPFFTQLGENVHRTHACSSGKQLEPSTLSGILTKFIVLVLGLKKAFKRAKKCAFLGDPANPHPSVRRNSCCFLFLHNGNNNSTNTRWQNFKTAQL